MKENRPFETLFDADDKTISRIAAQCSPEWDDNDVFERSYRKYQAKRNGTILRTPRRREFEPIRALVTAACLLIAVGGAGSIWFFRYGVEKPQMTIDTETAPTEQTTAAETTATPLTTTQTTAASRTKPTETILVVPETAAKLHTTAVFTSIVPASTATAASMAESHTTPPAPATQASQPVQTAQPVQTTSAAVIYTPVDATPHEMHTVPAQTTAAPTTETPTTATVPETTILQTETTAAPAGAAPGDSDEPQEPSGFITENLGDNNRLRFLSGEQISPKNVTITLASEDCTLVDVPPAGKGTVFRVEDTDNKSKYNLYHYAYDDFYFTYRVDSHNCQEISISGNPGYLFEMTTITPGPTGQEHLYVLVWDDGTGVDLLTGAADSGDTIRDFAEQIQVTRN